MKLASEAYADRLPTSSRAILSHGSGGHHVDVAAAIARTHKPLSPIGHGRRGAISSSMLGRVGLGLVTPRLAPNDQTHPRGGGVAERHGWPWFRFHPRRRFP